ncbi:hypothetical protein JDV02_003133 [Purpureocillium takamizusanense]|uniref:Uncharacterized protein n=1 Tax=Purpureocillium takamizusanense TaxID=2060973 RepID=A0A9Q8QCK9_9HYPO|nr:uncharacterized protein JDV02_003133 [Purpureocillium takamizusanense]UNI16721.1 hypothetical protein JDV02_003133 [Purpureocillium takamizusanense]
MASLSPYRVFELLRHVQRQTMRCQQEAYAIKSPHVEYDEQKTFINACIDECWKKYDDRNFTNQAEAREAIINYARELERLTFRREAGHSEAEAGYERRVFGVLVAYIHELVAVVWPLLPEQTILRLFESSKRTSPSGDGQGCKTDAAAAQAMSLYTGKTPP